jgi:hypothetical protein
LEPQTTTNLNKYSVEEILDKADSFVEEYNYEMAQKFIERALEIDSDNPRALETAGSLLLEVSNLHYCLTDLSVDSNDITALVSGEQRHYFHLWGLQKPLVAFATRDFFRPHS